MTVQDTERAGSRAKRATVPETYDFRRPMTLARDHARLLEMAFETFGRQWGTQLTARLRAVCQISLESVTMRTYDEYVRSLPGTTAMVLCPIEQTRTTAVVQLPVGALMTWVDYLLGGPGRQDDIPERELTEIEVTLVRDLLQHALADLGYAFAAVAPLEARIRSIQYNPQFVQAVAASDPVIVASLSVHTDEREDTASMMIPADVLLAALRAGEQNETVDPEEQRARALAQAELSDGVQDVPVEVGVRFSPLTVRPADIVALAPGDVLRLNHPTSRPLDVVVDGVVLARAAAGTQGSRLACKIVTAEEF